MFNKWQVPLSPSVLHFIFINNFSNDTKVQFSSVAQLCPTLCNPMNCSTLGLPVHHQLLESTHTHVHWVDNANHLIFCRPLLLLPSIFPSIRGFSNDMVLKWKSQNPNHSQNFSVVLEKKCKKVKWLSWEALQIAQKRREAKGKGEKERYKHI